MTIQKRLSENEYERVTAIGKPPMPMLDGLRSQFDQAAQLSSSQEEDQTISLTQAVIYDDKRAHFIFSDKTALILHPNGDCFTLFSRNG